MYGTVLLLLLLHVFIYFLWYITVLFVCGQPGPNSVVNLIKFVIL